MSKITPFHIIMSWWYIGNMLGAASEGDVSSFSNLSDMSLSHSGQVIAGFSHSHLCHLSCHYHTLKTVLVWFLSPVWHVTHRERSEFGSSHCHLSGLSLTPTNSWLTGAVRVWAACRAMFQIITESRRSRRLSSVREKMAPIPSDGNMTQHDFTVVNSDDEPQVPTITRCHRLKSESTFTLEHRYVDVVRLCYSVWQEQRELWWYTLYGS